MRKILLLGISAFFATAGAASAATTLTLDGFCNAYKIRKNGGGFALLDTGCTSAYGGGVLSNIRGLGKNAIIALHDPAMATVQYEITFSYPFTEGGTWNLYSTDDGVTFALVENGTYSTGTQASRGSKSVTGN